MSVITETKDSTGVSSGLFHTLKRAASALLGYYRHRQTLHELSALDDHLLDDIGVQRDQLRAQPVKGFEFTDRGIELPRYLLR